MYDGVINVYKEKGFTSHDVVAKMRGIFRQKKIGHTGTLDPDAEGVLPVCLGNATKLCDMLTDRTKAYRAVLLLGVTTDTQDAGGTVLSLRPVTCTEEEARAAVMSFTGTYAQVPPMYSALKVNGQKLVDLARRGIEVERKPREVQIFSIGIEELCLPRAVITVSCSKGTYIRTLCHDIGERLGCGGCMESLLRIRSGSFLLEDTHRLSELSEAAAAGDPERYLIPTDRCLEEYEALSAVPEGDRPLKNGNPLDARLVRSFEGAEGALYRVYDSTGVFTGLYRFSGQKLRPEKMFLARPEC